MPNHRLPSLDRLLVFDAAARWLSFTKAAGELFITQSAVSRQVAALEGELGVALFQRRHRALDLTDDGRRLAAAVSEALTGVRTAVAQIRAPHGREVLTLTTTPGLASLWLIPRLAGFTSAFPGIDVRIDASHDLRSLASDGFDLAIRYGNSRSLEGTPLFDEVVVPVCAPALLRRLPLKRPAVAGQGVVLGRRPITDALLKSRALVAPFKGQWSMARGYALVMSAASAKRPSAMALHDWLLAQAAAAE